MAYGKIITASAVLVPISALLFQLFAWVSWGVDIPYMDDWRIFVDADAGSVVLSDLFRPENDTIYATGKFLDATAVLALGFNSVVYQFISMMICLGALIYLQVNLLFKFVKDPLVLACSCLATIFMMQVGSYWGLQNNAFHQAIPLVALLLCIQIQLSDRLNRFWRILLISFIGTVGGLAYISGAFAVAAASICGSFFALRAKIGHSKMRDGALGFGVATIATLPLQLWVILIHQNGNIHRPDAIWSMPWHWEFWSFLLGMIARALSVAVPYGSMSPFSLCLALIATGLLIFPIFPILIGSTLGSKRVASDFDFVYLTLSLAIGFYLVMVVASRATLGSSPNDGWAEYFARGGGRFHFFWVTILLPWCFAFWMRLIWSWTRYNFIKPVFALLTAFLIIFSPFGRGFLDYKSYYQSVSAIRSAGFECIQDNLLVDAPIFCPVIYPGDITDAVYFARSIGLPFTKYFLFSDELPAAVVVTDLATSTQQWLDLPVKFSEATVSENGTLSHIGDVLFLRGGVDARFIIEFEDENAKLLSSCRALRIRGELKADEDDLIQVFYTQFESPNGFSESNSASLKYIGGITSTFEITVYSRDGFGPSMRIDPGNHAQDYLLSRLSASCR